MAKTLYSFGLMTPLESWRAIRSLRAEPGGQINQVLEADKGRKRVFHMALEQAQQQFSAAELIGYESRPLNLFYGLSQAGRAIAAASTALGRNTERQWQANGHGLKFDQTIHEGLFATPIRYEGGERDLFSRVSLATNSPLDFGSVDFGAAINQLVDYTMEFRQSEGYLRPLGDVQIYSPGEAPIDVEVYLPDITRSEVSVEELRRRIAPYPAIAGYEIALDTEGNIRWSHNEGRFYLSVPSLDHFEGQEKNGRLQLRSVDRYRHSRFILPKVGQSNHVMQPLMTWWAVLFALSTIARYAPSEWSSSLSILDNPISSRVEFLLDTALDAVPEMIWRALKDLEGLGEAE